MKKVKISNYRISKALNRGAILNNKSENEENSTRKRRSTVVVNLANLKNSNAEENKQNALTNSVIVPENIIEEKVEKTVDNEKFLDDNDNTKEEIIKEEECFTHKTIIESVPDEDKQDIAAGQNTEQAIISNETIKQNVEDNKKDTKIETNDKLENSLANNNKEEICVETPKKLKKTSLSPVNKETVIKQPELSNIVEDAIVENDMNDNLIESVRLENKELKNKIVKLQQNIVELHEYVNSINVASLSDILSDIQNKYNTLLSTLNLERIGYKEEIDKINNDNQNVIKQLEDKHEDKILENNNMMFNKVKEIASVVTECVDIKMIELKQIESEIIEIEQTCESYKKDLNTKENTIKLLEKNTVELNGDINDLKLEVADLKKQNSINTQSVRFLTDENKKLIDANNDLIQNNKSKDKTANMIINEVKKLNIDEFIREFETSKSEILEILGNKTLEKKQLLNQISEIKTEKERQSNIFNAKIKDLENKLSSELHALQQQVEALKIENDKLSNDNTVYTVKCEKIGTEKTDLESDLNLKNEYVKEMEIALAESQKNSKFYQEQLIKSDKTLNELKNNKINIDFAEELEKINRKHKKEVAALKLEIEQLKLEKYK